MGATQTTSFSCNLRIIRARNVDQFKHIKNIFVRCYFSAGNNEKVEINSQEISSKSDLYWNNLFSMDCSTSEDSLNLLKQGSIVIELRYRRSFSILSRSKVLGRAEIPWRIAFESPNIEIETWVSMISKNGRRVDQDVKPPGVQIGVQVNIIDEITRKINNNRIRLNRRDNECGCMDGKCNNCLDYVDHDMFALGVSFQTCL